MRDKHIGKMAGVFEIVERMNYNDNDGHALYRGICKDCGFERIARLHDLGYTNTCTHIIVDGEIGVHHTKWVNDRIGNIFKGMKDRCYNINDKNYRWYGAKGINLGALQSAHPDMDNDIVLPKSYRNPKEILVMAHAVGFGIYNDKLIQMLQKRQI